MKEKLDRVYIDEAVRIRSTYFKSFDEIKKKEFTLNKYREELEEIMLNANDYVKSIKNNKMDERMVSVAMNDHLNNIESAMEKIKKELKPVEETIEQLKIDAKVLFDSIREKYPNMQDIDIQKELFMGLTDEEIK